MKNENVTNYRIDRAYEKIYELNEKGDAYYFLCSFYQIGVSARDSDNKIVTTIKEHENRTLSEFLSHIDQNVDRKE